jgi:hypothetical protein
MQNDVVLPLVVYGTTAVYVISGLLSMLTGPNVYEQISQGELSDVREDCVSREGVRDPAQAAEAANEELEREARQMLQARSDRLVRAGQPPLDVERELAKLTTSAPVAPGGHDPELVEEVRQLTIARNERRMRQGLELLDVEVEIERALAELDLDPLGGAAYAAEAAREDARATATL